MPTLELVSHALCPYVQRAAIALAEKGVPFTRTMVDLADRPDWFTRISPLGKVPLLRVGTAVVFESAVILEYLEDTAGPALHPADALQRAQHRAWIEYGSAVLNDIWHFYTAPADTFEARRAALRARLERLEGVLGDGPWFAGARFSLVDAVFCPVWRYWEAFDAIGDFGLLDGLPKLLAWRAALAARPSVRDAVARDYALRLRDFIEAQGGRLGHLSRAARLTHTAVHAEPPGLG
jgi:glutathione S-transferase